MGGEDGGKSVNVTFLKKHEFSIGVCLDMICIQGSLMFVQIAHTKNYADANAVSFKMNVKSMAIGERNVGQLPRSGHVEVASLFENLYMYANLIYVDIYT